MSDNTKGETQEEYLERIKNAPGIFSDFNETAKDVVNRAERLVHEAEVRLGLTDLAPDPHPDGVEDVQHDAAVGFVYPGTDEKSVTGAKAKEEPKEETPEEPAEEPEEEPVEEAPTEEPEPVEESKPAAKESK
jgi:outer membrane biosynthesis protein TonB